MIYEIPQKDIESLLLKQLSNFFTIDEREREIISDSMKTVLARCDINFSRNPNKYYHSKIGKESYFNPYHSGQWTIFLYYFSHHLYKRGGGILKDKFFYLNKIMNGIDIFYDVELPDFFTLNHQVGSVIGKGKFSDGFSFIQNCTVGESFGKWPTIGKDCCMCAGSSIIGDCYIGENVLIGANATVKNETIPSNVIVFGESPKLIIKQKKNLTTFYW